MLGVSTLVVKLPWPSRADHVSYGRTCHREDSSAARRAPAKFPVLPAGRARRNFPKEKVPNYSQNVLEKNLVFWRKIRFRYRDEERLGGVCTARNQAKDVLQREGPATACNRWPAMAFAEMTKQKESELTTIHGVQSTHLDRDKVLRTVQSSISRLGQRALSYLLLDHLPGEGKALTREMQVHDSNRHRLCSGISGASCFNSLDVIRQGAVDGCAT